MPKIRIRWLPTAQCWYYLFSETRHMTTNNRDWLDYAVRRLNQLNDSRHGCYITSAR